MPGLTLAQAGRIRGPAQSRGQPKPPPLKGIRRQLHHPPRRTHRRPIHLHPTHKRLPHRQHKPAPPTLTTTQRRHHHRVHTRRGQGVLHPAQQHRMRTGLHKHPTPRRTGGPHRPLKLHRLADVSIPIPPIQTRTIKNLTGHRGNKRHRRGARRDPGQPRHQRLTDFIDRRGMGGIIHLDAPRPHPHLLAVRDQLPDRLDLPGNHYRVNTIDRRHTEAITPRRDQLPPPIGPTAQRHHRPRPGQPHQQPAAHRHHLSGIGQR